MKYTEIKTKTKDELSDLLNDLKKEQYNLRFQKKKWPIRKNWENKTSEKRYSKNKNKNN